MNIIEEINIGFQIPNFKKLINIIAEVLDIETSLYIMPMKVDLDDNAYVIEQGGKRIIFIKPNILKGDKLSSFNIRMFIHEMTHIKQMESGDLKFSEKYDKIYYKGEEYDRFSDYSDRPFEVEARRNESKLFKKVKQLLKQ